MLAVIIDVVSSREHPDQRAMLRGVADAVALVAVDDGAARSAGPTTGDELQLLYGDEALGRAILDLARLRLRLHLTPPSDRPVTIRAGIGTGEVTEPDDAAAPGQSGSAWWSAREALEWTATPRRGWPEAAWWFAGPGSGPVQAALLALETVWHRFDDTDLRCAQGLLDGLAATALAAELGVQRSTLSERLHTHGVYGWVRTLQTWAEESS